MCSFVMKLGFQVIGTLLLDSCQCMPNLLHLRKINIVVGVSAETVDEGEACVTFTIADGGGTDARRTLIWRVRSLLSSA